MLEARTNLKKTGRQAETLSGASSKRLPAGSILRKFSMLEEKWLPVVGYEGLYEVSDRGNVRSYQQRKVGLKIRPYLIGRSVEKPSGRVTVGLWKNGKESRRKVHHLVLEAFLGQCPKDLECCHNDGNARNNHLDNLRWDTKSNNALDRVRFGNTNGLVKKGEIRYSKITPEEVREIRKIGRTKTIKEIAKQYPIKRSQISNILLGYSWQGI